MNDLYIYTLFDADGRPRCTGVRAGDKVQVYDLYRPGAGKAVCAINASKALIRNLILRAGERGVRVVTSDFKSHLAAFDLPLRLEPYNVYDLHLPDVRPSASQAKDNDAIRAVLAKMPRQKLKDYQKLIANAAVVYQDLQNRGLFNNYTPVTPIWSQKTFSGRSKTTGFNIQGFTDQHLVFPNKSYAKQVLIHFDWICADIRVASLLSGDERLEQSFDELDPYVYMRDAINATQEGTKISRDECKVFLLKSINSMDLTSVAFQLYEGLGDWIGRCRRVLHDKGGYLETLLQRRFRVAHAKNQLAVLNGAMQGSVAHAMQAAIRRIWERLGERLVAEIHDSLVVCSPADPTDVKATINTIAPIMLRPLEGLLPSNPVFPFKVSIGKRWRSWELCAIYRKSGVEYVKPPPKPREGPASPSKAEEAKVGPSAEVAAEAGGETAGAGEGGP